MDIEQEFVGGQQKKFDDFMDCVQEVINWFAVQWPESTLRLNVNLDNGTPPELQVKCQVLTGKEMTFENQGFFENKLVISLQQWNDLFFMDNLMLDFVNQYQEQINRVMNKHYQMEQERLGVH